MTTIWTNNQLIQLDMYEKIEECCDFVRDINKNLIKTSNTYFKIELYGEIEYINNLIIGEQYKIKIDTYMFYVAKNSFAIKYPYETLNILDSSNNIYEINHNKKQIENFVITDQVIQTNKEFIVFFQPILNCILVKIEYNKNICTMVLEEVKNDKNHAQQ